MRQLEKALVAGTEKVSAWADLLDDINVYPVADGDTGRNLKISLSPLTKIERKPDEIIDELMLSARGNSGNIAASFFSGFISSFDNGSNGSLAKAAQKGRELAWKAIADPKEGTILSLFDDLTEALTSLSPIESDSELLGKLMNKLEVSVHSTTEKLPELKNAGVVDAGALGMYIFFEAFFCEYLGLRISNQKQINDLFSESIKVSSQFEAQSYNGFCLDAVIKTDGNTDKALESLSKYGESVVAVPHGDYLKLHLHTDDVHEARGILDKAGEVVRLEADDINEQIDEFTQKSTKTVIHIVTDAAGSFTRKDASKYGVTLLDSYINLGNQCVPETTLKPEKLYSWMSDGNKVSTSQASVYERSMHYEKILGLYDRALYLCVGSVFTGNYETVTNWKKENDPDDRLTVIDTGAASGRLGLISMAVARYSMLAENYEDVIEYARQVIDSCEEFIFLDKLTYLAAGGRLSKTSAFFGDMLKLKPIVTPKATGAEKVGVARHRKDQVKIAFEKAEEIIGTNTRSMIMLEYSDNKEWIDSDMVPAFEKHYPDAEVFTKQLSLTSGAHMGPGTWAVAFLPMDGE